MLNRTIGLLASLIIVATHSSQRYASLIGRRSVPWSKIGARVLEAFVEKELVLAKLGGGKVLAYFRYGMAD
jgi:hypothetical protein